jgi:hypothetical protein
MVRCGAVFFLEIACNGLRIYVGMVVFTGGFLGQRFVEDFVVFFELKLLHAEFLTVLAKLTVDWAVAVFVRWAVAIV